MLSWFEPGVGGKLIPGSHAESFLAVVNGGISKGSVTEAGLKRRTVSSPAIWRETMLTPMSEGSFTLSLKRMCLFGFCHHISVCDFGNESCKTKEKTSSKK